MTQFAVAGPLDKPDLDHDLWFYPVRAQPWQANGFGKRWFRNLELVQLGAQFEQQFGIESGTELSCENEITVFVITDQQRAETYTLTLRIRETAHQESFRQLALHFEPLLRAPVFV